MLPDPQWVLKGVSFTVRPGHTLALVGHTGAGKTTVISLLLRFYDPQRGRILIDGRDIRTLPLDTLRSHVGYVQQDIFLFATDIATNIRLSAPLSDAEVERAAARVAIETARAAGGHGLKVATVVGDDLTGRLDALHREHGQEIQLLRRQRERFCHDRHRDCHKLPARKTM